MPEESLFIGGAPNSFFQPSIRWIRMHCHWCVSGKDLPEPVGCYSTGRGYAQRLAGGTHQKTSTQYTV
jgi:hypothetical protein